MLNFSKYKFISLSTSVFLIVVGFIITYGIHKGFAHSLDFNGGLRSVVQLPKEHNKESILKFFDSEEIKAIVILLDKEKNQFQIDVGLDSIPRIINYNQKNIPENSPETKRPKIEEFIIALKSGLSLKNEDILSADEVGAVVGNELTSTGISLLIYTMLIMTIYLSFRFQFKFAMGASFALLHDLLFSLAFMGAFQIKPSVPIIAALLTLLGYSINDTIVIFDRIRENSNGKNTHSFTEIVNISINQTLGRTINTSLATLISIIAIILGGATELYDFAIVLIFGIFIGTYSSIFIAAPFVEIYDKYTNKA
jgi:preprotein translocase subunit SecF